MTKGIPKMLGTDDWLIWSVWRHAEAIVGETGARLDPALSSTLSDHMETLVREILSQAVQGQVEAAAVEQAVREFVLSSQQHTVERSQASQSTVPPRGVECEDDTGEPADPAGQRGSLPECAEEEASPNDCRDGGAIQYGPWTEMAPEALGETAVMHEFVDGEGHSLHAFRLRLDGCCHGTDPVLAGDAVHHLDRLGADVNTPFCVGIEAACPTVIPFRTRTCQSFLSRSNEMLKQYCGDPFGTLRKLEQEEHGAAKIELVEELLSLLVRLIDQFPGIRLRSTPCSDIDFWRPVASLMDAWQCDGCCPASPSDFDRAVWHALGLVDKTHLIEVGCPEYSFAFHAANRRQNAGLDMCDIEALGPSTPGGGQGSLEHETEPDSVDDSYAVLTTPKKILYANFVPSELVLDSAECSEGASGSACGTVLRVDASSPFHALAVKCLGEDVCAPAIICTTALGEDDVSASPDPQLLRQNSHWKIGTTGDGDLLCEFLSGAVPMTPHPYSGGLWNTRVWSDWMI